MARCAVVAATVAHVNGRSPVFVGTGAESTRDSDGALTDPYRLARSLCLAGATAAGVTPIDTVFTKFRDLAGL